MEHITTPDTYRVWDTSPTFHRDCDILKLLLLQRQSLLKFYGFQETNLAIDLRLCSKKSYNRSEGRTKISHKHLIPPLVLTHKPCANSITEYSTLIIGPQIIQQLGVEHLEAYDDSNLIVNQMTREYEIKHEVLIPYHTGGKCMKPIAQCC